MSSTPLKVAVLMTSTNQRDKTVLAIKQLFAMKPANWNVRLYFVDDGSTDGTADALESLHVNIKVTTGDGTWLTSKSLHAAQASIDEPFDVMLWQSSDVTIFHDTYQRIEEYRSQYPSSLLVAQLAVSENGEISSGGYYIERGARFRYQRIQAEKLPTDIDTFDGDLVLIPATVVRNVGSINGGLHHPFESYDFGLRAIRKGVRCLALPGNFGTRALPPNPVIKTRGDGLRYLRGTQGSLFKNQLKFFAKHGGWRWPLYFTMPYIRILLNKSP